MTKADQTILVGPGAGGQDALATTIANQGYNVVKVPHQWPRDEFVQSGIDVVTRGQWVKGNKFGEGGYFQTAPGYLLISDAIANDLTNPYEEIKKHILQTAQRYFPSSRSYIAPSGYFQGAIGEAHIDMFTLLVPKQKLLLIGTHFGGAAHQAEEYEYLAQEEGLTIIRYDDGQDGVWFPLNALVVPEESEDVVVLDSHATSLEKLLHNHDVRTIPAPLPQPREEPGGRIHCQTNTYTGNKDISQLLERLQPRQSISNRYGTSPYAF